MLFGQNHLKAMREPEATPRQIRFQANSDLEQVAYEFGKYPSSPPSKTFNASQACEFVLYQH